MEVGKAGIEIFGGGNAGPGLSRNRLDRMESGTRTVALPIVEFMTPQSVPGSAEEVIGPGGV
jgi:hypothetical protein